MQIKVKKNQLSRTFYALHTLEGNVDKNIFVNSHIRDYYSSVSHIQSKFPAILLENWLQ